ncbi:MAG TPA: copper resistance CopC family protein [Longimicrobiaceae bacterium]
MRKILRARWMGAGVMAIAVAAAAPAVRGVAGEAHAAEAFHLRLVRSTPASDAILPPGPCHIELWFTEAPELPVTSLRLAGPGRRSVALTRLEEKHPRGENPSIAANTRGRLEPGRYTLTWRTMAHDGHVMRGTINFSVAAR